MIAFFLTCVTAGLVGAATGSLVWFWATFNFCALIILLEAGRK